MEIWAGQDKPRKESPSSDRRSSVWSRKSPIPSLLYKYRCADAYTIALLKGQLYFAPPRDLNDPTELNLMYGADLQYEQRLQSLQSKVEAVRSDIERDRDRVQKHHWELYEKAFGDSGYGELDETGQTDDVTCEEDATFFRGVMHSTASRMSHQIEEQMRPLRREVEERAKKAEQTIEPVRSELSRLNKAWQQALGAYARQDMGLLCLSSEPDTYQMWSLYADGFRGVCVGFDTYRLTSALMTFGLDIIGPYWVKYRNLTFDDLLRPKFMSRRDLYLFKPRKWAHEKEVRFVRRGSFGVVTVPLACISRIILGDLVSEQYRKRIARALSQHAKNAAAEHFSALLQCAKGDAAGKVHVVKDQQLTRTWRRRYERALETDELSPQEADVRIKGDIPF